DYYCRSYAGSNTWIF
nr:immunoglobulin light chain junction region [Macaca mulatta]MOW28261.1 immunoglobulin light chain junction region [Macaca mulatta]MOW29680.1 immunoglobulin light chain junction region [Macaca mulatta]MOW30018.1 immunoglobulin light chain junction region [Macaca mulatta]MOW30164.1 immunoglobulin light chain junction region [Macaca mulatta]